MGKVTSPEKVKLIVGMISSELGLFEKVKRILVDRYKSIDLESQVLNFDHTTYYNEEMGEDLKRKFLSFKKLISPEEISDIKVATNKIESKFLDTEGSRRINLDPGYISESKLVLASTKDYQHRIYLKDGIYAEVTLRFTKGTFKKWEWTYPDYRAKEYISFFNHARKKYVRQIKE